MVDLNNYKGVFFEDENEKYQCPSTGAHFRPSDLCQRLDIIRVKRGDPQIAFDENGNKIDLGLLLEAIKLTDNEQTSKDKYPILNKEYLTAKKELE